MIGTEPAASLIAAVVIAAYAAATAYVAGWLPRSGDDDAPRLSGWRHHVARVVGFGVLAGTTVLFVPAIPLRYAQLLALHQDPSPAHAAVLRALGLSGVGHARLVLSIEIAVAAVFIAVALFIFLRRPRDWVAMLASAALATYAAWTSAALDALAASEATWRAPVMVAQILGVTNVVIFLFVFPNGRLVPRWSWIPLILWGAWALAWALFPASPFDLSRLFDMPPVSFALLIAWWGAGLGAQVYRYRRFTDPVQRQQTKWILSASVVVIAGYLAFGIHEVVVAPVHQPSHAGVVFDLFAVPVFMLMSLVAPIAFTFSILRYRLWGIDVVISRALVYTALAPILGGLYTASITLSQRLFVALTGEESDAAIVLTTLIVGVAFTSLRERLQTVADRLLREPPRGTRAIRAFNDEVRSFVELLDVSQLTRRALVETARAFDAGSGAVYLERRGQPRLIHAQGERPATEEIREWLECEGRRLGWIALGARRGGAAYTPADRAALADTAALVARAVCLARPADPGGGADERGAASPVDRDGSPPMTANGPGAVSDAVAPQPARGRLPPAPRPAATSADRRQTGAGERCGGKPHRSPPASDPASPAAREGPGRPPTPP